MSSSWSQTCRRVPALQQHAAADKLAHSDLHCQTDSRSLACVGMSSLSCK